MPELPEVEVTRRHLAAWTSGRTIVEVHPIDPAVVRTQLSTLPAHALPDGATRLRELLVGARTDALVRHGKRLGWRFVGRERGLLLHLGMTGQWLLRRDDVPTAAVRLVLELDDGHRIWFEDVRRFGCIAIAQNVDVDVALRAGHGADALDEALSADGLRAVLRGKRAVKVALMDQAVLAGIGNIEAVEALWRAGIHPDRACVSLRDVDVARLADAIPETLRIAISNIDTADYVYVTQGGENTFQVYDREGEPCPRCNALIAAMRHSGRSTYFCPACQPAT